VKSGIARIADERADNAGDKARPKGGKMTPREAVLAQIRHEETIPIPYTLSFEEAVASRMDQHYGGPHWRDRLTPYMLSVRALDNMRREPLEGGIRARDMYGGTWRLDRRPWHLEKPPLAEASFDGYRFPQPEVFFLPDEKKAGIAACKSESDGLRVARLGWGLFETSWGMRGFENALVDSIANPDFYEELLDRLTENFLTFVRYSLDMPVDAVMFGDDWGDQRGVILGPARWRKFLKPRWAKIYEAVHEKDKLVMSHCCGSVVDIMPDIIEIGLDVLESVQPMARGMNPYELKRRWGDKITFWGGLCSQRLIPFGRPSDIAREIERLRTEMGVGGGYILAPAKGLQPETPTKNAVAILEAFTAS
jgi:uroporphyrinogen decarboxylase